MPLVARAIVPMSGSAVRGASALGTPQLVEGLLATGLSKTLEGKVATEDHAIDDEANTLCED
jgi:hypothetical protein